MIDCINLIPEMISNHGDEQTQRHKGDIAIFLCASTVQKAKRSL